MLRSEMRRGLGLWLYSESLSYGVRLDVGRGW